jgi:hypothetical protein
LLNSATLQRYIQEFKVTGLTSNPTILDHAIKNGHDYDGDDSRTAVQNGTIEGNLFLNLPYFVPMVVISKTTSRRPASKQTLWPLNFRLRETFRS